MEMMQWVGDKPPPPKGGPWLAFCSEGEWTYGTACPDCSLHPCVDTIICNPKVLPHGGFHSKEAAQEYVKKLAVR